MVNQHGKWWQRIKHSLCSFSETLNPRSEKKNDSSQYILLMKSYCFDLQRPQSSKACHHPGYPNISRFLSDCCPAPSYLTHPSGKSRIFGTFSKYNEYLFFRMLSTLPTWSWMTVPTVHFGVYLPLCQWLSWRNATQFPSRNIKCNWESSLDWDVFSFGTSCIEVGLHTSVSLNILSISFWHSEWLVFLRTRRGLGISEDVTGLIR